MDLGDTMKKPSDGRNRKGPRKLSIWADKSLPKKRQRLRAITQF